MVDEKSRLRNACWTTFSTVYSGCCDLNSVFLRLGNNGNHIAINKQVSQSSWIGM